jgi:predicted CoA-binding protein
MEKKTLIIGASEDPTRYANMAANRLRTHGVAFVPLGLKTGSVAGEIIQTGKPDLKDIHTVTLYINPKRQPEYYDYIISLQPKRVVFNPGTENDDFAQQLENKGIEAVEGCTLVMLGSGVF